MTPSALILRRGTPADAKALAVFAACTFKETYSAFNTAENMVAHLTASFAPDKQAVELADADVVTVLAEVEGALAGFAQVRRHPAPKSVETIEPRELWRFYVDQPWQGKGLAAPLMQGVRDAARDLGGRSVWLSVWKENRKAVRFYEKCGFRIAGSRTFQLGDDPQSDHVMVVPLF